MSEQAPDRNSGNESKNDNEKWGVDVIEELRRKQKELVREAVKDIDPFDKDARDAAKQQVYAEFDDRTRQAVKADGLDEQDPAFQARFDYLRQFSIDNMSQDEWQFGHMNEDGTRSPSGRETVRGDQELDASPEDPEAAEPEPNEPELEPETGGPKGPEKDDDTPEDDPKDDPDKGRLDPDKAWDEAHKEKEHKDTVDKAHGEALAEVAKLKDLKEKIERLEGGELEGLKKTRDDAFAERMRGPAFGKKKQAELQTKFEDAEKAYLDKVKEYEQAIIERDRILEGEHKYQGSDRSQASIDAWHKQVEEDLKQGLVTRANERFQNDENGRMEAMLEQGGMKAKFLNWYANRSTGQKMAMTAVGAAAGVGIGLATGGIGYGIAAAAGAGASRFARGYATRISPLYRSRNADEIPKYMTQNGATIDAMLSDDNNEQNSILKWMREQANGEIEKGDKTKKRAVYWAAGSVAVGSTLSFADDLYNALPEGNTPGPAVPTSEADPGGNGSNNGSEFLDGSGGSTEFSEAGVEDMKGWLDGRTVQSGDTIWDLSEEYLKQEGVSNPTDAQIDAVKDQMVPELQQLGIADEKGWLYAGDVMDTDGSGGGGEQAPDNNYSAPESDGGDSGSGEDNSSENNNNNSNNDSSTQLNDGDPVGNLQEGADTTQGGSDGGSSQNESGGETMSAQDALAERGITVTSNSITFEKSTSIREVSSLLNEYYGTSASKAQLADAITKSVGQEYQTTIPAGTYNTNGSMAGFIRTNP